MYVVNPTYVTGGLKPIDISDQFIYESNVTNFKAIKSGNVVYLSYNLVAGTQSSVILFDGFSVPSNMTYPNFVIYNDIYSMNTQGESPYIDKEFFSSGQNGGNLDIFVQFCFQIT